MGKGYFQTLMIAQVQRRFPFTARMTSGTGQRLAWAALSLLLAPSILFKAARFTLPYVELVLTEKCNLRCAGCANLMPLYPKPRNLEPALLLSSLDALLEAVGGIDELALLGGEPFLYPHLSQVIAHAHAHAGIKRVKLITNGTILPKADVLACLKSPKVFVSISEYDPTRCAELARILAERGISFELHRFDSWNDYGGVTKRGLNRDGLRRSFAGCPSTKCKTLYRGVLYACPRAAHLSGLGILAQEPPECADVLDLPPEGRRKSVRALYEARAIEACDYCNPYWAQPPIAPGVQL